MLTGWNHCRVFTASRAREREGLGDALTAWIAANPGIEIVETVVRQSSDSKFHCLSFLLFYRHPNAKDTAVK